MTTRSKDNTSTLELSDLSPASLDGEVDQPDPLVSLSVQLGEDLTPEQDVGLRLDSFRQCCVSMLRDLDRLNERLQRLESTVGPPRPLP